jgi:hypothetical protein
MYEYIGFHRLSYLSAMEYSEVFKGFCYSQFVATESYFLDVVTNRILYPRKNNDVDFKFDILRKIRESSYEK